MEYIDQCCEAYDKGEPLPQVNPEWMDSFLKQKNLKKVLTPVPAAGRGKWRLLASRNNTSPSSGRMLSEGNVFQTIRKNGINKEFGSMERLTDVLRRPPLRLPLSRQTNRVNALLAFCCSAL